MRIGPTPVIAARSIGPAVPTGEGRLEVRGVYRTAANLRIEGWPYLVSLTAAEGRGSPTSVELALSEDFPALGLRPGAAGRWGRGELLIGDCLRVGLGGAARRPRELPAPARRGPALRRCVRELTGFQEERRCELRLENLGFPERSGTGPFAARLAAGAGAAVEAARRRDAAALVAAAESLAGLGPGLTPAGDDFLCGLMAAAAASSSAPLAGSLAKTLAGALRRCAAATTEVSASCLALAADGYFHDGLLRLCGALGLGDGEAAGAALGALCRLGHSSGADLATGLLAGLDALAA